MIHYACDSCGRSLIPDEDMKYNLHIFVSHNKNDYFQLEDDDCDCDNIKTITDEDYHLCSACYEEYAENPFRIKRKKVRR